MSDDFADDFLGSDGVSQERLNAFLYGEGMEQQNPQMVPVPLSSLIGGSARAPKAEFVQVTIPYGPTGYTTRFVRWSTVREIIPTVYLKEEAEGNPYRRENNPLPFVKDYDTSEDSGQYCVGMSRAYIEVALVTNGETVRQKVFTSAPFDASDEKLRHFIIRFTQHVGAQIMSAFIQMQYAGLPWIDLREAAAQAELNTLFVWGREIGAVPDIRQWREESRQSLMLLMANARARREEIKETQELAYACQGDMTTGHMDTILQADAEEDEKGAREWGNLLYQATEPMVEDTIDGEDGLS